ncbi:uncharacterized protein A4U43_C06F12230 [Asparagus officinalis]|uniref:Kinesin-like protein n=1 Tax=Asparagus officinalis TaxID=4686 RepID=A0A5P1ELD9_ASPOF|nr:uncharacterized protein A4U43_C06F12230 [Asparagus officinalis]
MGSVDVEAEAAKKRSDVVEWLNYLFPDFNLPLEASDEELRALLLDGFVFFGILGRINPSYSGEIQGGEFVPEKRSDYIRGFASAVDQMGLPCFKFLDLEQGSMSSVVMCLLSVRDHIISSNGNDGIQKSLAKSWNRPSDSWRSLEADNLEGVDIRQDEQTNGDQNSSRVVDETNQNDRQLKFQLSMLSTITSEPTTPLSSNAVDKFHEVFQLKQGRYSDLPASKISEMMKSNSLESAPTQSLLSVMNGILDESIERKSGEIPQRVACLLKKVVQEIERRISTQAEHIRKQNNLIKARERKFQSRIRALETLASGSSEEAKIIMDKLQYVKDLKASSESIKDEVLSTKQRWTEEFSSLGKKLKVLTDAAENYHVVLAENRKLFNEVQELKGNIRVYCRIRPFLSGENRKSTTIDYIGENGELLLVNPFKQGKDGNHSFKFNRVFGPAATQEEIFLDIQPLIRSVLDGYNVCIFAYGQTGSGKTYTMTGPNLSTKEDWGVNYRALNDLFNISRIMNSSQPNGLAVPDASLHLVNSTSDVLELMQIGLANRAVGATALNERSSRSHSIVTVHVRGADLKTGATLRSSLNLVDLAGSERVDRSEVTGDRLREAQHINKSLSALGDVIFALSQKSSHVPYRNSKLTQVLQSSLGGQAKTLMFVQINPDVKSYSETFSTLKFAERVSGVELGAARSNKESKDIRDLMEQVASLKGKMARKDEEIERLQLLKDMGNQSPENGKER